MKIADVMGAIVFVAVSTVFAQGPPPSTLLDVGQEATQIFDVVTDLCAEYESPFPYALALLDFYGRELELGIAGADRARLARATTDLKQTWNRFERDVLERGASMKRVASSTSSFNSTALRRHPISWSPRGRSSPQSIV